MQRKRDLSSRRSQKIQPPFWQLSCPRTCDPEPNKSRENNNRPNNNVARSSRDETSDTAKRQRCDHKNVTPATASRGESSMHAHTALPRRSRLITILGVCSVSLPALASTAQAQVAPPAPPQAAAQKNSPAPPSADESGRVRDIVVTAQRRRENLQTVPISAQVVTGVQRLKDNLNSLNDVAETTPSIHIGNNGHSSELFVRGIGSGVNHTFAQSVST